MSDNVVNFVQGKENEEEKRMIKEEEEEGRGGGAAAAGMAFHNDSEHLLRRKRRQVVGVRVPTLLGHVTGRCGLGRACVWACVCVLLLVSYSLTIHHLVCPGRRPLWTN